MKAITFAPMYNTGGDRPHDADYFRACSQQFAKVHDQSCGVRCFDNRRPLPARLTQVLDWFDGIPAQSLDTLVFSSHGLKNALQWGANLQNVGHIAAALKPACKSEVVIVLYACSAARDNDADQADDLMPGPGGEGGMADALRDAMLKAGIRATIYAHAKEGDAARNPYVRRFDPAQVAGGEWVIEPHSELWPAWVSGLKTGLQFRFPVMKQDEIEAELRGGHPGLVA